MIKAQFVKSITFIYINSYILSESFIFHLNYNIRSKSFYKYILRL
jgi:hypothetical protein